MNGKPHDFRLVHPYASQEAVFAIELKQQVFFPLQDFRHHICALQKEDGALAQWVRYSAFGKEELFGETISPWRFANRRAISGLLLFTHRFYNPELRRWQTTDPLGFEDGMNLYRYVYNNPFYYRDPDGQFAFVIPLVTAVFGPGGLAAISGPTIGAIIGSVVGFTAGWAVYEINKNYDENHEIDESKKEEEKAIEPQTKPKKGKDNEIKGGPPRDPKTANYLPDPAAEGSPHTTLGIKEGRNGPYTQGATFNEKGEFEGRTDVTDHGRGDHVNPHYHPQTGPNSAKSPGQPIS